MPFRFSYQTVLRLRQSLERREQLRLEAIARELARERQQLEELRAGAAAAARSLAESMAGGATGAELHFHAACAAARAQRRESIEQRIVELERRRQSQQDHLLRARQDREVLESLRRRQWEAYAVRQTRREQQAIDEQFLLRQQRPQ